MFVVFEYSVNLDDGWLHLDPKTDLNKLFQSQEEAEIYSQENCLHNYIIIGG